MYVREEDILRAIYYQLKLYIKEHFISDSQYKQELMRLDNEIDHSNSQYQEIFRNAIHHYEMFVDGKSAKMNFEQSKMQRTKRKQSGIISSQVK